MTIEEAFARRLDGITLTTEGKIIKILADDTDETPHQRFILEVPASPQGGRSGHTLLIAHNLIRAYRVPVKVGDEVEVRGTYVWNKYGGLLHNTHHYAGECTGKVCKGHEDGYINFAGQKSPQFSQ